MLRVNYLILIIFITISGCTINPEQYKEHIEGYWEIHHVEKNKKIIKEYTFNAAIDYFKVNSDNTGFRKKVSPISVGTFIVSQHFSPFTLKTENDSLNIYYKINDVITKETIIKASESELVITNSRGFTYNYKPYKKLNSNNE
ncbi:MAG: hypothetical protein KAJ28_08540 [Flavobacteriaceae bacterium]|nr:hypothetical protein [Flavobacteriaceae bacterium]